MNNSTELKQALTHLENVLRLFPANTYKEHADFHEEYFVELTDQITFKWRDIFTITQNGRKALKVINKHITEYQKLLERRETDTAWRKKFLTRKANYEKVSPSN